MQCGCLDTMDLLSTILIGVISQSGLVYCESQCRIFKTCGDCTGHALERCVWCAQDTMNSSLPENQMRCQPQKEVYKDDQYITEWCPRNHVNDPDSKNQTITNKDFNGNATAGNIIQFHPQQIELTLRPGVSATFDMYYKPATDYPLDIYFVIDSSFSMGTIRDQLAKQTSEIFKQLKSMTDNVRLGFGSFLEKPALPYCDVRSCGKDCIEKCYAFKHRLSLTEDMKRFKKAVSTSVGSGINLDSPEAGFDALMQIMTCGNKIGWRDPSETGNLQSRRIIILATDATYHSAGDGKMIGAYTPNDMECHLDSNNRYYDETYSTTLDYPSVSQINYVAKKHNFRIVFAVTKTVKDHYDVLANQISDIANTVELKSDKIIEIIRDAYISATRSVKLRYNNKAESIILKTDCDNGDSNCTITQENSTLKIIANVKVMNCDSVPDFDINPIGLSEKLSISLKIDCQCQCENGTANPSSECNSAGVKQCGVCKCNSGRSGDTCEIECSDSDALKEQCMEPVRDANAYCSNHGKCVCGKCECENSGDNSFSGEFCQFNDNVCRKNCPVDRGECKLGQCHCFDKESWTGPTCSCLVSNQTCIGPFSKEVCSGRGKCECGKCILCNSIDGTKYFGNYCESCKDCSKAICEQLKDYANCNFEKNTKEECDSRFNQTTVQEVTFMNKTALDAISSATGCRKTLPNGKIIIYKYQITTDNTTDTAGVVLMIQDELVSPPEANIWIVVGSIVGGVVLTGLLTLIVWKILTDIYDRKEYEKFCKDATLAGFDVTNPCYVEPNFNFVNPSYETTVAAKNMSHNECP